MRRQNLDEVLTAGGQRISRLMPRSVRNCRRCVIALATLGVTIHGCVGHMTFSQLKWLEPASDHDWQMKYLHRFGKEQWICGSSFVMKPIPRDCVTYMHCNFS